MRIKNLRESREELDLKQKDIAKLFNVNFSTVSGWETGRDTMPIKRLIDYANIYGYSLDYLFGITYRNVEYYPIILNIKSLGKKLKHLRLINNFTQVALAKKLNTTQSTISSWENGIRIISTSFLIGLIGVYKNISCDELFDRKKY